MWFPLFGDWSDFRCQVWYGITPLWHDWHMDQLAEDFESKFQLLKFVTVCGILVGGEPAAMVRWRPELATRLGSLLGARAVS